MTKGKDHKPHIGIFGRRNYGKSSIINAITGQDVAIISEIAGTTTDPVKKSVEIEGIGPAVIIDTAGIDDVGDLGELRVKKTLAVIRQVDFAILVITNQTFTRFEQDLINNFNEYDLPYLILYNKSDLKPPDESFREEIRRITNRELLEYSAVNAEKYNAGFLKTLRSEIPKSSYKHTGLIGDLVTPGDIVLLITPIDIEAPEGRLILPQVQVIRDVLDNDCTAIVLKEREVDDFLRKNPVKPSLVITDSQVFLKADASIPRDIPLTSFSIVLARQKGDFASYIKGTPAIGKLKDGDRVLLLESCSHHVSCDDIGRVKIPRWISNFSGKKIEYDTLAGLDNLPRPISDYSLVIQCGGCMITHKQLKNRLKDAINHDIPVSNYGMAIAYVHGIFNRAVEPFLGILNKHDEII
ncbi:MAG: [FeFe] hydrogenase H-cluster maturation GTPase HydF [Bacteroidales bacterium]|nr:[FeFe] hydrogenase H-cluster maturation GTPase HydF [Bacteroidales bacterium]